MTRAALFAAFAMAAYTGGVQEPPARFSATEGALAVEFHAPADVRRICGPGDDPHRVVVACCRSKPVPTLIMPNPWECGPDVRCAALWRHEAAHCLRGWHHELF